jgi:cell division protein FtsW
MEHAAAEFDGARVARHRPWPSGIGDRLDRPLTSYYLILGIAILLLGIGMLMAISISSWQQSARSMPANSLLQRQAICVGIGIACMLLAASAPPRVFRAAAYPLLCVALVGLCLELIGAGQDGAPRWFNIGGQQVQPSEIAKFALVVWGSDLLARKYKLGLLADWRHYLIPLMPGVSVVCLLVMGGNDLATTFILLMIFLTLLWVIGTPGPVFGGMLILVALTLLLLVVSAPYRFQRIELMFLHPGSAAAVGPDMQAIQGKRAFGSGGWFGVGLSASSQKWSAVPNATTNFIFTIVGEDLGLIGASLVTLLYGGLAYTGMRIARRSDDIFIRLAATGAMAWIVIQAFANIGGVLGLFPVTGMSLPLVSYDPSSLLVTMITLGMLMSFAKRESDAIRAIAAGATPVRRALSWLGLVA